MLSGVETFAGKDVPTVLSDIVNREPPSLAERVPGLPAEVEQVLRRALSKRQSDRFPTISAFARAFGAATTPRPIVVEAKPEPRREVTPRPQRNPPRQPSPLQRLGTAIGNVIPGRRKRRKHGVMGMTVAMGKRAIEELFPPKRKRPWLRLAWISAAAVGVTLVLGAVLFLRAGAWTAKSSASKSAPVLRVEKPQHR